MKQFDDGRAKGRCDFRVGVNSQGPVAPKQGSRNSITLKRADI